MSEGQLITQELITLYQLDTTALGGQWFYFTSAEDAATLIVWGGQQYSPLPMQAQGFEMTTKGAIPQPSVTISNVYGAASTLLREYKGLLGAKLIRILTLRRFLDDGSTPDANALISRDVFVVAQKTSHTPVMVAFKLASAMDQQGVELPRRLILRDLCSHVYRTWRPDLGAFDYSKATCPYSGVTNWDVNDQVNVPPPQDQCSRTMIGCMNRFPGGQPLPARFFPAVGRVK